MSDSGLPKISVIIPAYNSGATVRRAVRSALDQTYEGEMEVIVIDDGSMDDTSDQVKELALKDERVRLIIKPNGGVSAARNDGIMAATGEWFVTLDADDYMDREMVNALCDAAIRTEADTVMCGFRMVYDDGRRLTFKVEEDYTDDKDVFLDNMLVELYDKHMISTHSNQLYNTAIVRKNRIFYNESIAVNEDIDYVLRYLKYCRTIGVIKGVYLNYIQHGVGESLITTFQEYGTASSLLVLRDCNELFEGIRASDETIDEMNNRLFLHICSFLGLMYYRSSYSDERKIAEIKELCSKEDFADLLEDLRPKGVKSRVAFLLLKSGRYEAYHRLCLRLYGNLQNRLPEKDGTSEEKAAGMTRAEMLIKCREPYEMLGIYSDIHGNRDVKQDKVQVKHGKGAEKTERASEYAVSDIDTDVIMKALEQSADDSAGHENENDEDPYSYRDSVTGTGVTMEDILKVRELISRAESGKGGTDSRKS